MELPEIGLYIATKKQKGMRLFVEEAFGDDPDEFYLVQIADDDSVGDYSAMGEELDKEEWESLVSECGLEYQGNNNSHSYFEYCQSSGIDPDLGDSTKEYGRHLEKVKILRKVFSPDINDEEKDRLLAELHK